MVIGFAGRARHGKDTVARHAQTLLRDRAVTRGFAVALKDRIGRALPEFREAVAEKPPWMRGILQAFGNGVREADANFWVNTLMEWWDGWQTKRGYIPSVNVLLVPDVRYPNEVAAIKARGGKVVKVVRLEEYDVTDAEWHARACGATRTARHYRDPNTDPNHPSEAQVDAIPDSEFDAIFYARSGETARLEKLIEERLREWGLVARNDGGMGDDL